MFWYINSSIWFTPVLHKFILRNNLSAMKTHLLQHTPISSVWCGSSAPQSSLSSNVNGSKIVKVTENYHPLPARWPDMAHWPRFILIKRGAALKAFEEKRAQLNWNDGVSIAAYFSICDYCGLDSVQKSEGFFEGREGDVRVWLKPDVACGW